ncbi:MAG TPA: type VI secretion system baseplate subunit TssE [Bryobacteraceae bacterium]|nr:type VI secretion system baseplate subunit TssE [Bryobacteraceae bacterium]
MARSTPESAITLSVLDRLIDLDPRNSQEVPLTRAQSLRLFKDALRRDLEWLLNTRRVAVPPDESLKEVNKSGYIFGLPDFTGYKLSAPQDQTRLLRYIQTATKLFEPRLANVKVVPIEAGLVSARTMRLRIEGLMLVDPAPEHVSFDTVLELTSGQYEVTNAG